VSLETSSYTYVFVVLTVLVLNWWSICFLPIVIPLSKSAVHRCSKCNEKIVTLNPFNLPSLKDEVFTLKCGECAVVLARTYLYVIGGIMLIGLLYIKYDAWVNAEVIHTEIVKIPNTWDEYKEDCGTEVLTKNALKYSWNFENKYQSKTINWDGYFMKATDFSSTWFHGDHSYTVLIKMANSETDIHADLILSFDDSARRDSKVVLDSLEKGNHV